MLLSRSAASLTVLGSLSIFIGIIPGVFSVPPDVTFLCGNMPEVCTNMCWAVRCANPTFSQTLHWDGTRSDSTVAADRRKSAGCVSGKNKCNKGNIGGPLYRGDGYRSCDEYPFATTSDSTYPDGHQVSRCVPPRQNSVQGSALSRTYTNFRNQGFTSHSLKINFGNPGSAGVNYCANQPCTNDGWEIQNARLSKREEILFLFYRTRSGIDLATIEPLEIGDTFERMLDAGEALKPGFQHGEVDGNIFIIDVVTEQIDAPTVNGTMHAE